MQPLDSLAIIRKTPEMVRVTWFGHSASLLEIAGQNILLDPMLSVEMGPVSWATPNRYNRELAITPEKLPYIAAVLISHDHYDHLDFKTIDKIKDKVGQFYVPLGIGAHLRAWGVPRTRITEMNWGDRVTLPGLVLHCTPSRHFSGRGLTNRNSTLWCSWVVQAPAKRVFYTGDGGYGPHFAAIGAAYGPFDLALVECGQYDADWAEIHMRPEQSVQGRARRASPGDAARALGGLHRRPTTPGTTPSTAPRPKPARLGAGDNHPASGRTRNTGRSTAKLALVGVARSYPAGTFSPCPSLQPCQFQHQSTRFCRSYSRAKSPRYYALHPR
jgi:L-ascorbate metabolism protein UlaG (beta-lactamase superfamily)